VRYGLGADTPDWGGSPHVICRLGNYDCVSNQPPIAICQNKVVPAGRFGVADTSIDNGSRDPDNDPITLSQSPPGPYPLGTNVVVLTVIDSHGTSNSCTAIWSSLVVWPVKSNPLWRRHSVRLSDLGY
jgi:hypothetical protein